jgi:benzil reductase ((S)-benzoin forming)
MSGTCSSAATGTGGGTGSAPVALVTGASRGIGAAVARVWHEAGVRLALCARRAPVLEDGPDVLARRLDVAFAGALASFADDAVARFGRIDCWVNSAAVLEPVGPLDLATAEEIARHLAVNVVAVAEGCASFARHVRARGGGGVLLNISSGAARHAYEGWALYCASKAAVDQLSEVLALEGRAYGLRVHAVAPGVVDTDMQALVRSTDPDRFPAVGRFRALAAEGRLRAPEDVARDLLRLAFSPSAPPDAVVLRLEDLRPPGSALATDPTGRS